MSDYVHTGRRSKMLTEHRTIEYRLMFGACYLLSLAGAIVTRLTPWRRRAASDQAAVGRSIFREASSAASVWVALVVHGFVTGFRPAVPGGKLPISR